MARKIPLSGDADKDEAREWWELSLGRQLLANWQTCQPNTLFPGAFDPEPVPDDGAVIEATWAGVGTFRITIEALEVRVD